MLMLKISNSVFRISIRISAKLLPSRILWRLSNRGLPMATKLSPSMSSERISAVPILAPHFLHLPRCASQEMIGIFSDAFRRFPQDMQMDHFPGDFLFISLRRRRQAWQQAKLPSMAPKKKAATRKMMRKYTSISSIIAFLVPEKPLAFSGKLPYYMNNKHKC